MLNYHFGIITTVILTAYLGSLGLVKLGKINLIKQRRFWNIILLFSFLISGILGLVLAFCVDQKLAIGWYAQILWIHVETGIVMALVSIFHLLWHTKYFLAFHQKDTHG
jgi:spermidine synthase